MRHGMVLVAGATYGIDPRSALSSTYHQRLGDGPRSVVRRSTLRNCSICAASGRMGRMFLSGLQIDRWGNCNVTALGYPDIKLKLPGGGGGCNLSCDAAHLTLWTTAHRAQEDAKGRRRFRLIEGCDFITNLGHRTWDGKRTRDLGHRGYGPQWLVTELGLFDFDGDGHMRLKALYPDTTLDEVLENTGFKPRLASEIEIIPPPEESVVDFIRRLDPLKIHEKELRAEDIRRQFSIA